MELYIKQNVQDVERQKINSFGIEKMETISMGVYALFAKENIWQKEAVMNLN